MIAAFRCEFEVGLPTPADSRFSMRRESFLLVANYDSNVGYAWWLMESFWVALATRHSNRYAVILAYPSISRVPDSIGKAPLTLVQQQFGAKGFRQIGAQLRFLRERAVRVMYLTDAPASSWRYALYRLAGVRTIIVHDHTPGNRTVSLPWLLSIKKTLHRVRTCSADAMIAVTPFVRTRHLGVVGFPAERCFVAENGIPFSDETSTLNVHETFQIPTERRVLVASGRAHPVKGISTALDALRILIQDHKRTDVHFLFCGDGPQLGELVSEAQTLGIAEYVTFAGRQSPMLPLLRGCDLAIHPSRAEVGYSLSILEFMLARLPLVVSDDPSVAGAIVPEESGLTFETGNSGAAAQTILRLLDDRALAIRLADSAYHRVRTRYNLDRTHRQLIDAVDTVLAGQANSLTSKEERR